MGDLELFSISNHKCLQTPILSSKVNCLSASKQMVFTPKRETQIDQNLKVIAFTSVNKNQAEKKRNQMKYACSKIKEESVGI